MRASTLRPSGVSTIPGPMPCESSWNRVWLKKASNESAGSWSGASTRSAIGLPATSYFAWMTFFSITFFEPFAWRTRSSLGRLNAAVWTPARVSPAV
jgi:hypothetical protein